MEDPTAIPAVAEDERLEWVAVASALPVTRAGAAPDEDAVFEG